MRPALFLLCLIGTAGTSLAADNAPVVAPLPVLPADLDVKDTRAFFSVAAAANSLDQPRTYPWHLTATYETFDAKGASAGTGTFEEWRLGPGTWKRVYKSPQFSRTEYVTPSGRAMDPEGIAPPWPQSLIERELVDPFPDAEETGSPASRDFLDRPVALACVEYAQPLHKMQWLLGVMPIYCFEPRRAILRAQYMDGSLRITRNKIGAFRGSYFTQSLEIRDGVLPLLEVQVHSVVTAEAQEIAGITAQPVVSPRQDVMVVAEKVARGQKLGGDSPLYPIDARSQRIQGTVRVQATIGEDGHVSHLKVLESPDDLLTVSAVRAFQTWRYAPYLLDGKPVKITTELKAIYRLGY